MPHAAMSNEQLPWASPLDATQAIRTWAREWTEGSPHPLERLIQLSRRLGAYHEHLGQKGMARAYQDTADWIETVNREVAALEVPSAMASALSGLSPGTIRNQRCGGLLPKASRRGSVPLASLPLSPAAPPPLRTQRLMELGANTGPQEGGNRGGPSPGRVGSTADRIAAKRRAS